ncbi:hypothetical protein TIFTF001_054425 [Ficus carica]|uniref:Uncharacterized protein n=1 Tax=Ficus carica TaxID=3494 RepID=A0AA88EGV6_FICCA|nr:hypothetical protein TIFTF001_054425 [Ficus carica]
MDSAKFQRHRITFGQEQRVDVFCKVSGTSDNAGQEQRVDVFCKVSGTSDNVWQAKNNVQMDSAKFHRHRITFGEGQEQRADGFCKVS